MGTGSAPVPATALEPGEVLSRQEGPEHCCSEGSNRVPAGPILSLNRTCPSPSRKRGEMLPCEKARRCESTLHARRDLLSTVLMCFPHALGALHVKKSENRIRYWRAGTGIPCFHFVPYHFSKTGYIRCSAPGGISSASSTFPRRTVTAAGMYQENVLITAVAVAGVSGGRRRGHGRLALVVVWRRGIFGGTRQPAMIRAGPNAVCKRRGVPP